MRLRPALVVCLLAVSAGAVTDLASVVDVGPGSPGSLGVPVLAAGGLPGVDQPWPDIGLSSGSPFASAQLLVGPTLDPVSLPAFGATLWTGPDLSRTSFSLDGSGQGLAAAGSGAVPVVLAGLSLVLQAAVVDPGAQGGLAFSNGLVVTVGLGSPAARLFDNPAVWLTTEQEDWVAGAVAAADLDGDAVVDHVGCGGPGLVLVRGHPDGHQVVAQELPSAVGQPRCLELADLDGAGLPELVVGGQGGVAVHRLVAPGVLGEATLPLVTDAPTGRVRLVDLDQDGALDLVAASAEQQALLVARGLGDGSFARPSVLPTDVAPVDVALGDVDGDGLQDLLVVGGNGFGSSADLLVWHGRPGGEFEATPTSYAFDTLRWPSGVAAGDVDGDGRDDVVLVSGGGLAPGGKFPLPGQLLVVLATPDGLASEPSWDVPSYTSYFSVEHVLGDPVSLFDLDHDGQLDIVVHHTLQVSLGRGDGSFEAALSSGLPGAVSFCQLGGDEDLDVVRAGFYGPVAGSYLLDVLGSEQAGHGDGTFGDPTPFDPSLRGRAAALRDMDGDGALDLVTDSGFPSSQQLLRVYPGDGAGGFGEPLEIETDGQVVGLLVEDVSGDGRPDLVSLEGAFQTVARLRLQLADGSFGPPETLPVGETPGSLRATDVDGDGDQDLLELSLAGGSVGLLLQGAGGFVPAGIWPTGLASGGRLELADLDADGHVDLVVGERLAPGCAVLLADGRGGFAPAQRIAVPLIPEQLVLTDLDGDGRVDLLTAEQTPGSPELPAVSQLSVQFGLGDGGFGPATLFTQPSDGYGLGVADVDGDGDIDVLTAARRSLVVRLGLGDGGLAPAQLFQAGLAEDLLVGDLDGDGDADVVSTGTTGGSILLNRLH